MRGIHHVELWVADVDAARSERGWLLERIGFERTAAWTECLASRLLLVYDGDATGEAARRGRRSLVSQQ